MSAAVVAQLGEAGHLLARGEALAVFFCHINQEASVQLPRDLMRIGLVTTIVPGEVPDRLRKHPVLLVGALHGAGEAIDDIEIGAAVGDGLHRAEAPLRPAPAVDDAAFFFDAGTGGQNEHFGGNSSRIGARPFPEARRLVLEQIGDHHPLELVQPRTNQTRVGAAHRGVLTEAEEPLHLAGEHGVGEREKSVALSLKSLAELGQIRKVEVILARGMLTPPRFQQTDDILRRVLQPVGAGRIGRQLMGVTRLEVALQIAVRLNGHA